MKHVVSLLSVGIVFAAGCANTSGPRPPASGLDVPNYVLNANVDCQSMYPEAEGGWDMGTGYFLYEGADTEKMRRCLIDKYGWYELGPPDWREGTMAPPRSPAGR